MKLGLVYFILVSLIFGGIMYYNIFGHTPEESLLTEEALKPDLLLSNSKYYVREHAYDRSLHHLDLAIKSMRKIEEELDEHSIDILEESISNLMLIHRELEADSLNINDMDDAFSKALDALTYAELKVSEILLETDHDDQAIVALKYGMMHIKNALTFSRGHKKDYEIHIYDEIDSLLHSKSLSHEEMKKHLDAMIEELDQLVMQKEQEAEAESGS